MNAYFYTEQLISRNYGRKLCSSVGTIVGSAVLPGIGTAAGAAYDSNRATKKANGSAVRAQRKAAAQASAAQQAAASATPNTGRALDASAIDAAAQHRRGIQSTFLASRLANGESKLGA